MMRYRQLIPTPENLARIWFNDSGSVDGNTRGFSGEKITEKCRPNVLELGELLFRCTPFDTFLCLEPSSVSLFRMVQRCLTRRHYGGTIFSKTSNGKRLVSFGLEINCFFFFCFEKRRLKSRKILLCVQKTFFLEVKKKNIKQKS